MTTLAQYYEGLGYPPSRWHVGAEHPHLERYAIDLLRRLPRARVLEIGYQSGGFAVPVILAMAERPDFAYVGVDSLAYGSAVDGGVIGRYLEARGARPSWRFLTDDAAAILGRLAGPFDVVLVDHDKRLYPRDLWTVLRRRLVSVGGHVLLHDVRAKARGVWPDCRTLAEAYGCSSTILEDIPGGLAVLRRDADARPGPRHAVPLAPVALRIGLRRLHAAMRDRGRATAPAEVPHAG